MTKKNGLGEMAKGLDWIGSKKKVEAAPLATPQIQSNLSVCAPHEAPKVTEPVATPTMRPATPQIAEPMQNNGKQIQPMASINSPVEYKDILDKYQRCTEEIRALQMPLLELSLTTKDKTLKKLKKVKSSTLGLEQGFTRTTLIIREEYLERFKQMSHDHDASVKDILDLAITRFFKSL